MVGIDGGLNHKFTDGYPLLRIRANARPEWNAENLRLQRGKSIPLLLRIRATPGLMNAEHRRIQASAWTEECGVHEAKTQLKQLKFFAKRYYWS